MGTSPAHDPLSDPGQARAVSPLLSGARAQQLLARLEWTAAGEGDRNPVLQAAGIATLLPAGLLGRIGHGRLRLRLAPPSSDEPAEAVGRLIVAVRGAATITPTDGPRFEIRAGEAAFLRNRAGVDVEVDRDFLRYEYVAPIRRPAGAVRHAPGPVEKAIPVPLLVAQPFLALAGTVLSAPIDGHSPRAVAHLQEALDAVTAIILAHLSAQRIRDLSPQEASLVAAADALVAARGHDPGFGVRQLAEGLGVSRTWLHRVLAKIDVTPSAYLRQQSAQPR